MDLEEYLDEITDNRMAELDYLDSITEEQDETEKMQAA